MTCYYCFKIAEFKCDYIQPNGNICSRPVCEIHSVPEFKSSKREDWALCRDHEEFQRE